MSSPVVFFRCRSARQWRPLSAYTLVEILVVLFLLVFLASIALPSVKTMLANQKLNRAASNLAAFVDKARSRAISEERSFGILIERGISANDVGNVVGMSQSIRLRQLSGVPPYSGDASNAYATLVPYPNDPNLAIAEFTVKDNQLLQLSQRIYAGIASGQESNDDKAPIRNGDFIELPGGRLVPITFLVPDPFASGDAEPIVRVWFNLTYAYPDGARDLSGEPRIKYRIHRRPVVSSVAPFSLPRGVVIDLSFSGVGPNRNQFASLVEDQDIEIIFGADGSVSSVTGGWYWSPVNGAADWDETQIRPLGSVFLLLGDADGLVPNNLFSLDSKTLSNLLNLDSIWISIHPSTGRTNVAPMAPVNLPQVFSNAGLGPNSVLLSPNLDPTSAEGRALSEAIAQSRVLANLSDAVQTE